MASIIQARALIQLSGRAILVNDHGAERGQQTAHRCSPTHQGVVTWEPAWHNGTIEAVPHRLSAHPPALTESRPMYDPKPSRRTFVKESAVAVAATTAAAQLSVLPNAHAAGSDTLKVGLVGCGGRGTGAAEQALTADKNVKLVAMADAFQNRLEGCLSTLKGSPVADRVDVPSDR